MKSGSFCDRRMLSYPMIGRSRLMSLHDQLLDIERALWTNVAFPAGRRAGDQRLRSPRRGLEIGPAPADACRLAGAAAA